MMAVSSASPVLRFIRKLRSAGEVPEMPDGELLARFVAEHDQEAFTALVHRHGAMVLGVCCRVLGNSPDADDAFQATFLVLVRKAHSICKRGSVGSWLYGVAARVALKTRMEHRQRQARERPVPEDLAAAMEDQPDDRRQIALMLTEEINRLPDIYRSPVVLCHLEGKTHQQAAAELGCPRETVTTRLLRARERLRGRLARRGVEVPICVLIAGLIEEARTVSVPLILVKTTVQSAVASVAAGAIVATARVAALTKGAMMSIPSTMLKVMTAGSLTMLAACFCAGAGVSNDRAVPVVTATVIEQPALAVQPFVDDDEKKQEKPRERTWGFLGVMLRGDEDDTVILVHEIFPDSPAAKAGFKADDRILKIGETECKDLQTALKTLRATKPGDRVTIHYQRDDKEQSATVTLGKWPATIPEGHRPKPDDSPKSEKPARGYLGLKVRGDSDDENAVIVEEAVPDSPAAKAEIQQDDVILMANKIKPKGPADLVEQLGKLKVGDKVSLQIKRGEKKIDVTITAAARPKSFGDM